MIGERIKELRKSKKMSQSELGKFIGVSQTTVTAWENGRAEPSSSYVTKLATFFNVSTDYLLGRDPREDDLKTADLADDDTIFTFEGKLIPEQDLEYMKRLLRGGRK
ncbi:helix-turn-helix transcriptional regulator [Limosilactobacillus sp.]|uniref:helix-turn-helix domain-containing protein n=1 Tax=Limosilactobacillus sp. TaxID=2773925 RepID=UPI00258AD0B9|nr:helix-turn-helix transcriptional regulator [Limosilactobacillus sp.]MCC6096996.1 helix-turn-helix domain-containing protein [Limosilactobacillus sp.]